MAEQFIDEIVEIFSSHTSSLKPFIGEPLHIKSIDRNMRMLYRILNQIMLISEKYEVYVHENLHLGIGRLDALLWIYRISHEDRSEMSERLTTVEEMSRTEKEKKYEMRMMKSIVDNGILKTNRYFSPSSSDSQFITGLTLYIGAILQRLKDISYSTSATKLLFGTTAEDDTMMEKYEKMYYRIEDILVVVNISLGNIFDVVKGGCREG